MLKYKTLDYCKSVTKIRAETVRTKKHAKRRGGKVMMHKLPRKYPKCNFANSGPTPKLDFANSCPTLKLNK